MGVQALFVLSIDRHLPRRVAIEVYRRDEGLSPKDFAEPDGFFRMGTPPVMVAILPRISDVDFDDAWQRRVIVQIDDTLTVPFISRQDLLAAKIAAGRAQDLADVAALRESLEHSEGMQEFEMRTNGTRISAATTRLTDDTVTASPVRC
jgi:hypothetical protein